MMAVFRKELRLFYSGLFGYAVAALLLFFMGIFTAVFHLMSRSADFSVSLTAMQWVLVILVPPVSLRAFCKERHEGTEGWLFSLPLSTLDIVMGKFLSLFAVFALPTLLTALYPLLLSSFGKLSLPASYSAMCGYLLLIASLIAFSLFFSTLAKRRLVAALLSLGSCLLLYFSDLLTGLLPSSALFSMLLCLIASLGMGALFGFLSPRISVGLVAAAIPTALTLLLWFLSPSVFVDLVPRFLTAANPFARMSGFVGGYFDLASLLYYIGFSAFFLFATRFSLDCRRLTGGAR